MFQTSSDSARPVNSVRRTITNEVLPVNLALSFARRGIKTGILDTDIFGPSIPTLLNLSGEPRLDESGSPFLGSSPLPP